jgi:hypothetical protein
MGPWHLRAAESCEKVASGERYVSRPDAPSHTSAAVILEMKALFMLTVVRATKLLLLLAGTKFVCEECHRYRQGSGDSREEALTLKTPVPPPARKPLGGLHCDSESLQRGAMENQRILLQRLAQLTQAPLLSLSRMPRLLVRLTIYG